MTNNLKETAEEVKDYIVARLKVPIFFYYLLALALWNWDIILLIIKSNFQIESVILSIRNCYSHHSRVWIPLLIALGSSILFPLAMVFLDWVLKFINKARIRSAKEVAEAEAEAQYDVQVKRNKTDVIKELNTKITVQETELSNFKTENQTLADENKKLSTGLQTIKQQFIEESNLKTSIDNKLKVLQEEYSSRYKFKDIGALRSELSLFAARNKPEDVLLALDYYINDEENNHKIDSFKRYLILLEDDGYIVEEEDEELPFPYGYELTQKGFALHFYLLGIVSQKNKL